MNVGRKRRVFFDTNIIVYSHDNDSPRKRDRARELIEQAFTKGVGVVSGQVLGETFVTLTKKIGIASDAAADEISKYASGFKVVEISSSLVLRAIQLKTECQLSYWDALIIAAAESASCDMVWSEDLNDGQYYGEVIVRNPFVRG
jgi:predicted nucleic acid-binding protein